MPGSDVSQTMWTEFERGGPVLRSITDGEPAERRAGVPAIVDDLRFDFELRQLRFGAWASYEDVPKYRVRRGRRFIGDQLCLPFVTNFDLSYPIFRRLRDEWKRADLSFQVGIPGDLDLAYFAFGARHAARYQLPLADALGRQIVRIHSRAHDDVIFQLELLVEAALTAGAGRLSRRRVAERMASGVTELARRSPSGTRFGVHLCLGDLNHRAMIQPCRVMPLVHLANAIALYWPPDRRLEFVHIPLAAAAEPPSPDPKFYASLGRLRLPADTRLVAGLVHEKCDLDELRAIRDVVEARTGREVDLATSCGLGRRSRPVAERTIDLARALTTA